MILLIDNYDSFTFNLFQYFEEIGAQTEVVRNDAITLDEIEAGNYEAIVLSPGPKDPNEAGICLGIIERFSGRIPIFGVCLGHQCITQAFGGNVIRAPKPVHGKASEVSHEGKGTFSGLSNPTSVARYHSLIAEESSFPDVLRITARSTDDDLIMALRHREHPTFGVQFHPESILTPEGHGMLRNFLNEARAFNSTRL